MKKNKKGRKYNFWTHYHTVIELCFEGNQELLSKINSFDIKAENERLYTMANIPEKYFKFTIEKIKDGVLKNDANKEPVGNVEKYISSISSAAGSTAS